MTAHLVPKAWQMIAWYLGRAREAEIRRAVAMQQRIVDSSPIDPGKLRPR